MKKICKRAIHLCAFEGGFSKQIMKEEKMKIALTFDDGPHPSCTPLLLDGLKERGVKVTFFVIGLNVERYPELV